MLSESDVRRVYLACGSTNRRKSIDGLAALVRECFNLDPFSPCRLVFCNHRRDKIKILEWDHNGFWLYYYRRLEKGRFRWSSNPMDGAMAVTGRELRWLLEGLSLGQKKAHPAVVRNRTPSGVGGRREQSRHLPDFCSIRA